MIRMVVAASLLVGGASAAAAQGGYIGEGIQGRPHARTAAVREYYHRHGLGYYQHPRRYHRPYSHYYYPR